MMNNHCCLCEGEKKPSHKISLCEEHTLMVKFIFEHPNDDTDKMLDSVIESLKEELNGSA